MFPQASGRFGEVPQAYGLQDLHESSRGLRGHVITNFPHVMVLLIINSRLGMEIKLMKWKIYDDNMPMSSSYLF